MFSTSIFHPIIGGWIDSARADHLAHGLEGVDLELATGQDTLEKMVFPIILIVLFTILFLCLEKSHQDKGHGCPLIEIAK